MLTCESIISYSFNVSARFLSEKPPPAEQPAGYDDCQEESPAYQRKSFNKAAAVSGVFADVNAVIYDRSQRTDQRTETGGVGTVDESGKILSKRVQDYSCRHI